jgi:hypothetical protein
MIDNDVFVEIGRMIGMGSLSTWRRSAAVPLHPPRIPLDLTWARTLVVAVGS